MFIKKYELSTDCVLNPISGVWHKGNKTDKTFSHRDSSMLGAEVRW